MIGTSNYNFIALNASVLKIRIIMTTNNNYQFSNQSFIKFNLMLYKEASAHTFHFSANQSSNFPQKNDQVQGLFFLFEAVINLGWQ